MDAIPDVVDLVLWGLALLSVVTWSIMFLKAWVFRQEALGNRLFQEEFGQMQSVRELATLAARSTGTLSQVCRVGVEELQLLQGDREVNLDGHDRREMLERVLRQQIHLEQAQGENGLAVLASVGSTSPFIGLFGTVWGIMHALKSISASGSAGLDVVAGPIGEALIATAMGIAAAVPAVLAYNYFLRRVRLAVTEMEHFSERLVHFAIRAGL